MKNKIIEAASILYAKDGIERVSMEQLAGNLNISEDIIYIYFKDKEELLLRCLGHAAKKACLSEEEIIKEAKSIPEIILKVSSDVFREFSTLSPAFYKDIRKFSRAVQFFSMVRAKFREKCTLYFIQGAEEGYFIPGLSYEPIASIFVEEISMLDFKYQHTSILAFIQGICTEKGLHELTILT